MTQQYVIKAFVDKLANHGQAYSASIGTNMLDSAVRASSRYSGIEDVIAAMKADQINAEKEAVEEVLGSEYAGKTLAEVSSDILSASAKDYDGAKSSNSYYNDANDYRSTVENVIKERKAYIFLEKYCGIQLTTKYFFNENSITFWNNWTYDNTDTGAITGSDAGGSTPKTDRTIVPEEFNTYTAATSDAQNITTDNRAWVINATSYGDTITSNGADYINAGAGNDQITVNADGATVIGGAGEDVITISQNVRDVTIKDFNEEDTLTISGEFEIGSAKIEDTLLVITDKTGTRKIRLGDFETAKNAQINGTTLAELLHSAGIDFNNFATSNYSAGKVIGTSSGNVGNELPDELNDDSGRIAIDPDYEPSPAPEVVKKRLMMSGPIGSANTSSGGTVTVDLSTVDASISNDETSKEITGGTLSNSYPNASTFTRNGLTIHLLGVSSSTSGRPTDESTYESLITAKTFDELTDDQKTIIAGLFKWWGKECLKLNEESHNLGFTSDTAAVKEIGLYFFDGDKNCNTLATVWNWGTSSSTNDGAATQLMLNVNMKYYNNLSENDINGSSSISGAGFLDRTLAHEFNHAILASNVNYFSFLPKFIKEGIAELTHGIDDERGNVIFNIAYDADQLEGSLALNNTGTGSQEVGDGYAGGFMFWRYFAKQAAAQDLPAFGEITATVNLNGNGIYYINGDSTSETAKVAASLPSGAIKLGEVSNGVYTVENTGVHQVISATSAVKVVGLTVNDTFNGTSGADTVETSEGSNIITGAGNDSIDLRGQFATISTGADDDTVNVADGSHHLINLGDGNNLVSVAVFSYNDTILSGAGNDNISGLINGIGNVVSTGGGADLLGTYNYTSNTKNLFDAGEGDDNITVGAGYNNTFLGGAGSDVIRLLNFIINGNEYTTAITNNYIDAGADDDTVLAYGSNNTIVGGAGNDVIYSYGTGGNIFRFNKPFGEDVIVGLKANDTILLAAGYQMAVVASGTENDKNYAILQVSDKNDSLAGYLSLSDYAVSDTTFQYESAGQVIQNADASMVTGTNLDDNIINVADSATVDSRAGNDTILSMASNTSINAGAGNDQVSLMADAGYVLDSNVVELGDGADLAEVHTNSNIIKGGAGVDYVGIYGGNNNLVELGADNNLADIITDDNDSNGTGNTIVGGDAIDRIGVYASGNSVESGAGDDVIEVTSNNNTVNAGDDDDFVAFRAQKYDDSGNPVYDKDGNLDYNYYFVENNKIDLGAGNDLILLFGMSNTITGGTGNDDILNLGEESIETSANVYTFTEDNFGSDTIENFFATDKLVFADGMIYETQAAQVNYGTEDEPASGTQIIITVTKDGNAAGTITLENVMGDFDAATNIEGGQKKSHIEIDGLTYNDAGGYYEISCANDLQILAAYVNDGSNYNMNCTGLTFKQTADITFDTVAAGESNFMPIGCGDGGVFPFCGTFDGNNKTISNLTVYKPNTAGVGGLFGHVGLEGSIVNVNLVNVTVEGKNDVGGLVGNNGGTIRGCTVTGTVTGNDAAAGGIVGMNTGSVNGISYATVYGTGNEAYVGGLVGYTYKNGSVSGISFANVITDVETGVLGALLGLNENTGSVSGYYYTNDDNLNSIGQNTSSGTDNSLRIYKITLPDGVTAEGEIVITDNGNTYAAGNITLTSATDIKGLTRDDGGNYTINIDSDVEYEFASAVLTSLTLTDSDASAMTLAADVGTVDASARTKATKIVGNELDNSIAGGSGNDTLNGGDGDDTLTGNAGNDLFLYSGGNDVITDYGNGTDKISVTGEYSYELNDNDLILNFDDGKLTIKDAANTPITLNGASKKFTAEGVMTGAGTAITLNADVETYTADDSVVTINASATNGTTVIGNAKSNQFYSSDGADTFVYEHHEQEKISYVSVEGGGVSAVVSTIYSAGSDVIHNYGTNDKISLGADVELKDAYKQNDDVIVKVDSGTITVKDSADKAITFAQGDEEITFSGDVFSKPDTSILPATFDAEVTLGAGTKNLDASKRGATKLTGNDLDNSITGGKSSDTIDGGLGDDTLTGGAGSDVFVFSGGNDTITDYGTGSDKISAASDYQSYTFDGTDIIFNFADGSLTVKDGVGKAINFNGVAKVLAEGKTFNSSGTAVTLGATTTSFDATEFETLVTIDGSAVTSGLEVVGNAKANKIYAGTGGSTLDGGAGNDTLTGGAGADKFVYGVGNDVIENYGAGDKISLASDVTITDFYKTNDDLYIKFSAGSLTVKNTSSVTFEQDGKEFSYSDGKLVSGDSVILPATFTNEFTLDESAKNLDASKLTAATKLNGNALDNSIVCGKGADTLDSGLGDDTLTGGAGSDVFVFSGGNDTITDYGTGSDKISAASDYQSYEINGEDITFTFANGSLKLIGAAEKSININGVAKKFSADKTFNSNNTAITLGANATTYTADEIVVTIDGSAVTSTLEVVGNDKSNRIYAGNNGSTLNGGLGSDNLYGGDGADTFVYEHVQQEKTTYKADGAVISTIYSSGSDVIYNYAEGDKISLGADVVLKDAYKQNDDAIIKVDNGTITVKDSSDKSITIAQGEEEITFSGGVFSKPDTSILPATFDAEVTLGATTKNLDASKRGATKLTGNALGNSILGGKSSDTLDGGAGDDTLTGDAGSDVFVYSGGNDTITDYGTGSDKISIASSFTRESSIVSGNDIVWNFGEGNSLTIKDYTGKITTISASAAASIGTEDKFNSKNTAVTLGTATTTFDATDYPNLVTINAAATDGVSITGNAKSNRVYFGEGNDIFAYSSNETTKTTYTSIESGGVSAVFSTIYSSGSDIIYNYAEGDKISLGAGVVLKNAYKKNSDTIINVDNGTITLKDSADKAVTFVQDGEEITFSGGVFVKPDTSILPATFDAEVTLGATTTNLDASKRTAATKLTGNSDDNEIIGGTKNDTLDGGAGDDTLTGDTGSDVFVYTGGDDVIKDYGVGSDKIIAPEVNGYSIDGDNITFTFDTGTLKLEGAADSLITINGVAGKYSNDGVLNSKGTAITLPASATTYTADETVVTIDGSQTTNAILIGNAKSNRFYGGTGSTFVYKGGSDIVYNYANGDKISLGAESVLKDFYTKNTDVIVKVDSGTITFKNSSDKTITLTQGSETFTYSNGELTGGETLILPATFNSEYTLGGKANVDASKRTKAIKLTGTNAANSITGGTKNDTIDGGAGDDTLTGGEGSDTFIYTGGNDVIKDYGVGSDKIIAPEVNGYSINGGNITFTFDNGTLKLEGAADSLITINGVAGKYSNDGVLNSKETSITLNASATTYTAGDAIVTINGSRTNGVTVKGNIKNNQFYAGSGADVFVYEHNEYTVEKVTAEDIIENTLHGSGSDVIYNYGTGDKISLGADVILKNGYMKNADFVAKVDDGYITVKSSSEVTFTQGNNDFEFNGKVFASGDSVSIPATFDGEYTLGANAKNLNASMRTSAIKLTGNASDNSIVGGTKNDTIYGGAGADMLWGGKGNDTLYGGDGDDTFIFQSGDGKDTILDFASGDMLKILDADGKSISYSKASYSSGTLTLTVADSGGTIYLKNLTTSTNININGTNYAISGKTLK